MSPAAPGKSTAVLAVDTGGTFTDLLLWVPGRSVRALKVASTPDDPGHAVLQGIDRLVREAAADGGAVPEVRLLIHGSTVATNRILERKGARVALVTNRGFEDVIEIGRQNRPQLYALTGHRPPPLVERRDRHGIGGRLGPGGAELEPTDSRELAGLPERLSGAEAVAVVLLHSYADPAHEQAVARALEGIGLPLSLSSRILPEFREFERTATTVVNAYVAPAMEGYLRRLESDAPVARIRVMGSAGGALPLDRAAREPVHTVLSGPAGGVVGALEWARRAGSERILSFDMGGTSTDVSLVPGMPLHTREGEVGGVPIAVPLLDIHTVGAGGGSVAEVDAGGALRVGPESAGALPGPVCYGLGGRRITVTDAHVRLGRLLPEGFLGGSGTLDPERVGGPLGELARAAGRSDLEVAEGILDVVNTSMEGALRVISVERGVDPSDYDLVAFGGAAGLHAASLVKRLGLRGALLPPDPGLLSAFGMLVAPVVRDRARTVLVDGDEPDAADRIRSLLGELEHEARAEFEDERPAGEIRVHRWIDARYHGQSFELRVPAEGWIRSFHEAHRARYGYAREHAPVEAVTLRVRIEAPGEEVPPFRFPEAPPALPRSTASVVEGGREVRADVVHRFAVRPGMRVTGPALVLEYSSTTWCPPGWTLEAHESGVLVLRPG